MIKLFHFVCSDCLITKFNYIIIVIFVYFLIFPNSIFSYIPIFPKISWNSLTHNRAQFSNLDFVPSNKDCNFELTTFIQLHI